MGSVHHLEKFIPNLSQLCYPLRPLLKKNTKFIWRDEHEKRFILIREKIAETTENKHFNPDLETRIKCDASRKSLGRALEQRTPNGWHTVAFASRFLISVEDRYSINEFELLGVVWSVEHFKYFLYGKPFTVITDHRALLSIMRENRANKSRLKRWVDRLLPFDFTIDHLLGSKMGLVDYISRDPQQKAVNLFAYDEQFIVAKLDVNKRSAKRFLFNVKASINSIIYQLWICRQKTINVSPFEEHFGRKANTPLSNISTKSDPSSLTYENIWNKFLNLETVRWEELISEENWDNEERSDTELELNRDKLSKDAAKRKNEDPNKESRVIPHPEVGLLVPRTEASLEIKLAKKRPRTKRSKKSLDGLYEVLAPGSSVVKTNTCTSVIKEPGKRDKNFRNSDLAKFGTKAERQTELQLYANRRPKTPTGNISEDLISHHAKKTMKKLEGGKRMKHRKIADDVSAVSSIHSNVTRALRVRMPTKQKRTVITAPPNPPAEVTSDFAVPMEMPSTSIIVVEPPSGPKRKAASKASAALKPLKRQRSTPSVTESDESNASVQTCHPTASNSSAPSRNKRRKIIKQTQIKNKSIISAIKTAAAQS